MRLLLDCGTGVFSNLQQHVPPWDVTHIVISHLHADHFLDLVPFRYALWRLERGRPNLYLPPGGEEALLKLTSIFDPSPSFFSDYFAIAEYQPGERITVGDLEVECVPVKHYIPGHAIGVIGERKLVYSGDSGPCEELEELARDADLFLCEAARCEFDGDASWGHMSPRQAAEMAKQAGVKRLLLTHFWPECNYAQGLSTAGDVFGADIEVAQEHQVYTL